MVADANGDDLAVASVANGVLMDDFALNGDVAMVVTGFGSITEQIEYDLLDLIIIKWNVWDTGVVGAVDGDVVIFISAGENSNGLFYSAVNIVRM